MKHSSIKKNFAYQMSYEILVLILPLLTSPYVARVIGAEGLGIYSYSYSIAYYFGLVSMLGIQNYGNRRIARARDDKHALNIEFSNILAVHVIVSLLSVTTYVFYIMQLQGQRLYAAIQILYVLSCLFDISWFYFGMEDFKLTVARNMAIKILVVVSVFTLVKSKDDLWIYCMIMALGTLISQLILWIPLRRYVQYVRPSWAQMRTHIKPLFILFIPTIAISLYKYMDKIMIGIYSTNTELGFYDNAEKMVNMPLTVITSFGTVMLPKMSNLVVSQKGNEAGRYIMLSMKYVMCLAFALTFGLSGIARVFAPIFWGREFAESGILIMGLSVTLPFVSFANIIRTQYLIPMEKDREYLSSVIGGALLNLVVNYTLIPIIGSVGAMIGTIAAEILVCVIQSLAVRKELPVALYIRNLGCPVLFGLIMFCVVYSIGVILQQSIFTLLIQVVVGGATYSALCLMYYVKIQDQMILGMLAKAKAYCKWR